MTSQLSALSEILSSGIATIQGAYAKQGVEFPSLDDAHKPGTFKDEELMRTTNHVIAAATQLIAMVRTPHFTILEGGFAYMFSQSLDAVTNANIPEILREAGPQGLHIHEIGEKCGADPEKIGRILRYLATNYIFREVSIDVFANNRISLFLDTGKSVATIKANPIAKYNNTLSLGSLVSIDESFKAAAYFTDNLLDPTTAKSQDPLDSPFSRAHGRIPVFEFLEKPENEFRMRRFQAGMYVHATSLAQRSSIIVTGFDWGALRKDGVVVDVGGGKGTATLMLARAFPDLQFIIQDRSTVIPLGTELWRDEYPEALTSGRVKFAAHDFFTPQPIQNASVFFLRAILHDWPDAHAKKILAHLRGAASRGTKLIVIEQIIQYAAPSRGAFAGVKGADVPEVPFPLLPNLGPVSNLAVGTDLLMMTGFNAQERTVGQFIRMADGTGWEIESISRGADGVISLLVFGAVDLPSSV